LVLSLYQWECNLRNTLLHCFSVDLQSSLLCYNIEREKNHENLKLNAAVLIVLCLEICVSLCDIVNEAVMHGRSAW